MAQSLSQVSPDLAINNRPASVSIVICTYNGASRLAETLGHLARQIVPDGLEWEVVLVDNASTDNTAEVARSLWPANPPAPLRIIYEAQPGVAHARFTGCQAARFDVISFIDDDNWVCSDWITGVSRVFTNMEDVGACGSYGFAVFEEEGKVPSWYRKFANFYAVGPQGTSEGYVPDTRGFLWSAGLSIRTVAFAQLCRAGFKHILVSRTKTSLASGEDAELTFALRMAGWRLYYDPKLTYKHYMPEKRLSWSYFCRLQEALGRASIGLKHYELRLNPRWGRSPLLYIRNQWSGEILLCVIGCAAAALKSIIVLGSSKSFNTRLRFKWGKLKEVLGTRSEFMAGRAQVALLYGRLRDDKEFSARAQNG